MARAHQVTGSGKVGARQCRGKITHPLVLRHHVPRTARNDRVVDVRDVAWCRVAQRADDLLCRCTLAHTVGVPRPLERAVCDEADDDVDAVGNRYVGHVQGAAVDEGAVALARGHDAQLVHDARRHPGCDPLGLLHEKGETGRRDATVQCEGHRDLESRTRRQTGPDGHV